MDQTSSQQQSASSGGLYGNYTLPMMPSSSVLDNYPMTSNVDPYYVVLTPITQWKTLSLPRAAGIGSNRSNKRNSKTFIRDLPLVNPAFIDGSVRPVAISDYNDPLRLHHLPQQNPHQELVEIKTNKKNAAQTNNNLNHQHRNIPSFHLTKNVTSTLSKVVNPVEFCSLSRVPLTNNKSNSSQLSPMEIPLSSFRRNEPNGSTFHPNNPQQRFSTSSSVSNQSSDVSGDPSTTSSLYYVDYRQQQNQNRSSSSNSVSSASSTITGSSGDNSINNYQHQDTSILQTFPGGDHDLPPPPEILLRDDDDEEHHNKDQLTPTNKSPPPSSLVSISELLPPLPPSDYHLISTLQRRKFASVNNQSQKSTDIPAYSSTTLSSFQGNNKVSSSRSGTLRKSLPPPPPRPSVSVSTSGDRSVGVPSSVPSSNSSYADPSSISIGSSSSRIDNLTMSTHPTPSPTMDYQPSESLMHQQQQRPLNETKLLFNRNSATYGWVYHQSTPIDSGINTFEVKRCDSLSLAESSNGQPNSLESGDSRQPLSQSFDTNNNKNHKNKGSYVYGNRMFVGDEPMRDDDDDGRTKARIIDQSYKMFFDSPDDSGIGPGSTKLKHIDSKKQKQIKQQTQEENSCKRFCRSLIITLTLTMLILILIIIGASIYKNFVLHQPETGFSAVELIRNYFFGKTNTNNDTNTTASNSPFTPKIFSTLSTTVTILMNTWNLNSSSTTPTSIINTKTTTPTISVTEIIKTTTESTIATTSNIKRKPSITTDKPEAIRTMTTIPVMLPTSLQPITTTLSNITNKSNKDIETTTTLTNLDIIVTEKTTNVDLQPRSNGGTSISNPDGPEVTSISIPKKTTQLSSGSTLVPIITTMITMNPPILSTMLTTQPPLATIVYNDTVEGFIVHGGSFINNDDFSMDSIETIETNTLSTTNTLIESSSNLTNTRNDTRNQ